MALLGLCVPFKEEPLRPESDSCNVKSEKPVCEKYELYGVLLKRKRGKKKTETENTGTVEIRE